MSDTPGLRNGRGVISVPATSAVAQPPTTMDGFVRAVARIDSAPLLAPGQVIGLHYELIERIGGGGMGVVYRARDRRLGRDVAVKVLRLTGGPSDDDRRRWFEREAHATAQLFHPNIVTLLQVGEHEGHPYLVLELLSGETLAARLARRGRLPVAEALNVLDAVLAALAFAHERGVLHRDLKPNNVLITGDERVKVLDFGVALSLDIDSGPITRAAGTPGYMAPEQRDGSTAQDARTDVWAAAQLLLECLVGRLTQDVSVNDIDAPAAVRDVLRRALAEDPSMRPASAQELRSALAGAGGRLARTVVVPNKWRHRVRLAGLGLVSALAGGVLVAKLHARATARSFDAAPTIADMNTLWETPFGMLRLEVDSSGRVYGVYAHEGGVIVGDYYGGVLTGWWCEDPTRRPRADAGQVQMKFVRGPHRILFDGQWKYGDDPNTPWVRNWTGFSLDNPAVPELEQRMQHRATCPR